MWLVTLVGKLNFRGGGVGKLNYQVVIKSAASAASPTSWEGPNNGGRGGDRDGRKTDRIGRLGRGASQAVMEVALAGHLIMA